MYYFCTPHPLRVDDDFRVTCSAGQTSAVTPFRKRELEYRIPRLHSPENSRRFPEIFGYVCKNKASFL